VYIKYKLLPKGTYVRFQPDLRSFHEVVGSDPEVMKAALEASLMGYCTLSEGDWVQVRGGPGFAGRVLGVKSLGVFSGGPVASGSEGAEGRCRRTRELSVVATLLVANLFIA
jgi:hypothetical protein